MSRISLAKALRLRKTLKGEIADLSRRATESVSWTEGKERNFDFEQVNAARKARVEELVHLETAIAVTNANTRVSWDGREATMAELIRRHQELKGEISFVSSLNLERGTRKVRVTGDTLEERFETHRRGESPVFETITMVSAYTEAERVALLAQLRRTCEALNEVLEEANHRTVVEVDLS